MKTSRPSLHALLLAVSTLMACGGGGGGDAEHAPAISNLRISPASALQSPGGTASISGTVDFTDAGGDIASLRWVSSGVADVTVPVSVVGRTSGTVATAFAVSVDKIGRHPFELWAIDSRGSASNRLSGTFEVVADDTATNWTRLGFVPPETLYGIAFNGSQYVAVGARGTIMTSPDLNAWTVRTSGVEHTLYSVATSGSRFVAVGDSPAPRRDWSPSEAIVVTSTDGATWTVQHRSGSGSTFSQLNKVIWTGTQFVAVGHDEFLTVSLPLPRYALILTSPDGISWTQRAPRQVDVGGAGMPGMASIAASESLVVAVGNWGRPAAWTSTDAEVWTRHLVSSPELRQLADVTWGNGRFVAVGLPDSSAQAPAIFSSVDGIAWQQHAGDEPLPTFNAVTTGVNRHLAVGSTHRATSADGRVWNVMPSADCGNGVLWDGTRYVAVGTAICRSP